MAYHSTKTSGITEKYSDHDITSQTTSLDIVCFLVVCGGAFANVCHLHPPTHASIRYRLPTEALCFDREGEGGWEGAGFQLWKMEASFMTHVPCPPVKITPAVFQRCSIIGCTANENNGACGEETRQTKRERPLGRKYLQVYFIHIHHPFPSHQIQGRPLTYSHTCRNL